MIMNKFKERLRELRKFKNLTQKQLASKLNISEDCVYNWEKGRSEPSILDLINLSNYFNTSIDYLVGRVDF